MSQVAVSFASRLADVVGAGRIATDVASLPVYEADGCRPSAVLRASSGAEVAEILRFASAERLALVPTGGRTHLHIGMPPHPYSPALHPSGTNRPPPLQPD